MNEILNALCVLMTLVGVASITAGWLILTFSRLFRQRWLDAFFCALLIPAPLIAWQRKQPHAIWMLNIGLLLLLVGFIGSAIFDPKNSAL